MSNRIWIIAGLAAVGVAVGVFVKEPDFRPPAKNHPPAREVRAPLKKVFPYSVIPGGAQSGEELRNALVHDNVARLHYADFHLERTHVEPLRESRKVYVSYRIADRIYWTRKRLTLPKGETILTDGSFSARTRCGNRLSDVPQEPTNVRQEPSQEILDTPDVSQTAWTPPKEAETNDSLAAKLEPAPAPSGDLLSKFGPQSLGSMSGSSSNPSGPAASNPGTGSSPGNPVSTGPISNGPVSTNPILTNPVLTNPGTINPGSPPGTILPGLGSVFVPPTPPPVFTIATNPNTPPPVVIGSRNPPVVGTVPIPSLRPAPSLPVFIPVNTFPEEELWIPPPGTAPTSLVPNAGTVLAHETQPAVGHANVQTTQNTIASTSEGGEAQVPEPRTTALTLCGFAFILYRFLKSGPAGRRALR